MNVMVAFFRQKYRFFFKKRRKSCPVFLLLVCFCLAGCGEEDIEPSHFNPISPLPLRVDAPATPTASIGDQNLKDQEETPTPLPTNTLSLGTSTPLPETTPPLKTATPVATNDSEETSISSESSRTPTPSPIPLKEKPTPASLKSKATPTPTPVVAIHDPTATPKVGKAVQEDGGVTIDTLSVCAKVSDRTPGDCGNEFSLAKTQKIYTWMKLSEVKPPKVLKHVYYKDGEVVSTVRLTIKYAAMRTWSQKTFNSEAVGKWKVVITTEGPKGDKVIAVKEFTVVP